MSEAISPYKPASKAGSLATFTPTAMAYEIQESLRQIKFQVGDIDEYVRKALKYSSVAELYSHLAAEQIDAVALGIYNIKKSKGLVVGDQTGIGKGRIAAAVIAWAVLNGYKCIFITEKPTLFSDLYRDLFDIGKGQLVPFVFNVDDKAVLKYTYTDEFGEEKVETLEKFNKNPRYGRKTNATIERLIGGKEKLPEGYDFLMTTYSQLNQDTKTKAVMAKLIRAAKSKSKEPRKEPPQFKTEFLREFAKGAIIVMDEAHNASGDQSSTGFYLREILSTSLGACYLSATYAKRPDNMSTYAIKTSIDEAGLFDIVPVELQDSIEYVKDYTRLDAVFAKGGEALQEITAADMARQGEMIRRQRSFEGIQIDWKYLTDKKEEHAKIYDSVTGIMRDIIEFQKKFITEGFIKEMDKIVGGQGARATETQGTAQGGLQNTPYFNKAYQTVSQLLFSIKAVDVAKEAIELLNQNKKVVIAFRSTMETFMADFNYADGDNVESHDFSLVLQKALDGVMKFSTKDSEDQVETSRIDVEDLPEEAQDMYRAIQQKIEESTSGISMSPIDILINVIENAVRPKDIGGVPSEHYRVRECTGRKGQIKIEDGKATYRRFRANNQEFFRQFNSGEADVLLINASSSTGVSCHSSEKFQDRRQRYMLIHEPELDINKEVQKRGRVNRTGQVNLPGYRYVSSSIPAEKRLFMVLKKKLKSLDANTTGNQRANESQLEVDDFFNKYGEIVVKQFLEKGSDLAYTIDGYMKKSDSGGRFGKKEEKEEEETPASGERKAIEATAGDLVRKVTNIVALLTTKEQEEFYDTILQKYKDLIAELKRKDEYDLEAEFLDYKAVSLASSLFKEGGGGDSVFGKDSFREDFRCQNLRKPFKKSQIEEVMQKELKGLTPTAHYKKILDDWEGKLEEYQQTVKTAFAKRIEEAEEEIEVAEERLKIAKEKQAKGAKKEEDIPKLQEKVEKAEGKLRGATSWLKELTERKDKVKLEWDISEEKIKSNISYYTVGKPVIIPRKIDENTTTFTKAVVKEVYVSGSTPMAYNYRILFALASSEKELELSCEDSILYEIKDTTAKSIAQNGDKYIADIWENWNKHIQGASGDHVNISMITGNLLSGIDEAINQLSQDKEGGTPKIKIVKFTTIDGEVKSGLEMTEKTFSRLGSSLPISSMKGRIENVMATGATIEFRKGQDEISFGRQYSRLMFLTPSSNQYKRYWDDPTIAQLVYRTPQEIAEGSNGKFEKIPPKFMGAHIPPENLDALLKVLSDMGFTTKGKWEKISKEDRKSSETEGVQRRSMYELSRPYVGGEYPQKGFEGVEEYKNAPHGVIVYNAPLSSKQRLESGLIPVFQDPSMPYQDWKRISLKSAAIKSEFEQEVAAVKGLAVDEACRRLGVFIILNAHETGNSEFVFGRISTLDLGRYAYADFVGALPKKPMDAERAKQWEEENDMEQRILLEMLKIQIELDGE